MTARIEIPPQDRAHVRVFAVDLGGDAAKAFADDPTAIARALGISRIDPEAATVFPVSDLEGVGLTGYLVDGHGIAEATLAEDRAMLEGLTGYIAVLPSRALPEGTTAMLVTHPLRLIGTYREDRPAPSFAPLSTESAKGVLGGADPAMRPRKSGNLGLILLALILLPVLLIVVLFGVKT